METTTGWHSFGKTTAGSAWKVEDGVLHFDPAAKMEKVVILLPIKNI
jgi:hypothetical protein